MRFTAGLTSRRLRPAADGGFSLGTPVWVRLLYGSIAAILLAAGFIEGSFPDDFSGPRLPGTLLFLLLISAALWKALVESRLEMVATDQEPEFEIRISRMVLGLVLSRRRLGPASSCRMLRLMEIPLGPGRRPDGTPKRAVYKLSLVGEGYDYFVEESHRPDGLLARAVELGRLIGIPVEQVTA